LALALVFVMWWRKNHKKPVNGAVPAAFNPKSVLSNFKKVKPQKPDPLAELESGVIPVEQKAEPIPALPNNPPVVVVSSSNNNGNNPVIPGVEFKTPSLSDMLVLKIDELAQKIDGIKTEIADLKTVKPEPNQNRVAALVRARAAKKSKEVEKPDNKPNEN
jgi:hypothetical protein